MRRHLWALDALAVIVCACLAAHTTATLVEGTLIRADVNLRAPTGQPPASPAEIEGDSDGGDSIVRRNIFCSSCRVPEPPAAVVRDAGSSPCARTSPKLPLTLVAIMYAPAEPRWSTAILKRADGAVGSYGVGSPTAGAVIDAIDEAAVVLRGPDGARTCLALIDGVTTRTPKPEPSKDPLAAELEAGILRTGEHSYDVPRSTVESLLRKLDSGPPPARLEPDRRGGQTVGFRLREVRADGPLAQIGLREGDVISSINGLATSVPQNALAIYVSLRSVDHLSVAVQRDGRAITAEYDIQ